MIKKILTILVIIVFISCKREKCWCNKELESEWYRLVDLREIIVYLSQESPDSLDRVEYKQIADSLHISIRQIEYMMNNNPY